MIEGAITKTGAKGLGAEIPGKVYFGVQGHPGPPLTYDDLSPEQKEDLKGKDGNDGEDGGHYTPHISQPDSKTIRFGFTASKPDMPDVDTVDVQLPAPGSGGNVDLTGVVKSVNGQTPDENGNVQISVSGGSGGLNTTAVNLLIDILESAVYNTNVSGKIARLKEALASGGGSGGDVPDIPDEPDEPVADNITVSGSVMTIVTVGSAITMSDGVMTIA